MQKAIQTAGLHQKNRPLKKGYRFLADLRVKKDKGLIQQRFDKSGLRFIRSDQREPD